MNRVALTDGRWFDLDAASRFAEGEYFDGHNYISKATGSQWEHEALYRTAGGSWILTRWSDWQGSPAPTYEAIPDAAAAAWLAANGHEACAEYAELEIK
jgi:hypothetical protein